MASSIMLLRAGRLPMLGHADIDSDHQAITAHLLRTVACEPLQFPFFMARLKKLLRNHFDHEAELMERAGGYLCIRHREEHEALLDLCDQAKELSLRSLKKAQALLRSKFPKLVREHVLYMDQAAVLFLHTSPGTSPCGGCPQQRAR